MVDWLKGHKKVILVSLVLFAVAIAVYCATGEGHPNWYDYYVRLSDAFLHGRLYLLPQNSPSYLNELVPNPSGPGFYVVYPPLPAVLMMPLVAIFGLTLNQTFFSVFFGAASVVVAYFVAKDVSKKFSNLERHSSAVWLAVLFGFGTIFWWLSSNGSVWLTAQVVSAFFLLLSIHESLNKARPLIMGLLLGASFWCRLPTALGIFFFVGLIVSRQQSTGWMDKIRGALKPLLLFALGMGVFVGLDMAYNFVRFGALFDVAYWMIPGILEEPWFSHGLFSLQYIPENLAPFLTGIPTFNLTAPFMHAPIQGIAIWFTTPAFVFTLRSKIRDAFTLSCWAAIFAIAFVIFTKGLSGWGFGYRYAMDFYPFLFVLAARGMGATLKWYHKLFIVIGVVVNFWGTLAFNLF